MAIHNNVCLWFKLIHPDAKLPTRSYPGDVGFDLYAIEDQVLNPMTVNTIPIGICVARFEGGYADESCLDTQKNSLYLKIEGKSGLATKHSLFPVAGIIDTHYTGEIKVALVNMGQQYTVHKGDRVAQLVIYKTIVDDQFNTVVVDETDVLPSTERGSSGFGSTGS